MSFCSDPSTIFSTIYLSGRCIAVKERRLEERKKISKDKFICLIFKACNQGATKLSLQQAFVLLLLVHLFCLLICLF